MVRFFKRWSEIPVPVLSGTIAVVSFRVAVWPMFQGLQGFWRRSFPTEAFCYSWVAAAVLFACWIWVLLLPSKVVRVAQAIDATAAGILTTVAVALQDEHLKATLAQMGFQYGSWIVAAATWVLLIGRISQNNRGDK